MLHAFFDLAARSLRWLHRLPHRRGYGIHSPFAFTLVTDVIYNRGEYYAYGALGEAYRAGAWSWSEKDARLLFRLANHQLARRILLAGTPDGLSPYVVAARPSAVCDVVEGWAENQTPRNFYETASCKNSSASGENEAASCAMRNVWALLRAYDMLVLDGAWEEWLQMEVDSDVWPADTSALIVVREPLASPRRRELWASLCASPRITLSFDLHRLGLLYVRPKLNKQDYVVNYW